MYEYEYELFCSRRVVNELSLDMYGLQGIVIKQLSCNIVRIVQVYCNMYEY